MIDRVVVIEDEKNMSEMLTYLMEQNNFHVDAYESAEHFFAERPLSDHCVYLIDQKLPGIPGTAVVKTIRMSDKISPVFMISSMKDNAEISEGLNSGADDYLLKPFHPDHLVQKVNNARIRTDVVLKNMMNVGIRMIPEAQAIIKDGLTVNFTPKEFVIVNELLKRPNEVVTREELNLDGDDLTLRNVDVQVFTIRKKLVKLDLKIESIRGKGYRVVVPKPMTHRVN